MQFGIMQIKLILVFFVNVKIVKGVVSLHYLCIPLTVFDETPVYSSLCDIAHNLNCLCSRSTLASRHCNIVFITFSLCAVNIVKCPWRIFYLRHFNIDYFTFTLGHVPPSFTPNNLFFLPHFGAMKVWRQSLVSNVLRILHTTVTKVSLLFILFEKKWKGYIWFFFNTVYIWSLFCVILCVWHVISMLFGVPPRSKSWRRHSSLNCSSCSFCWHCSRLLNSHFFHCVNRQSSSPPASNCISCL